MHVSRLPAVLAVAAAFAWAASAGAATIQLSFVSSDATPASQLDATVDFQVGNFDLDGDDELQITLTNPSLGMGGDALFNINELFWNGSSAVTSLTLISATHSAAWDVTGDWMPVETGLMADGFGPFDFALRDGMGETDPSVVEPGENVVFLLDITSTGPVTDADFVVLNGSGFSVAAKFVNGPDDPEAPGMEDSAFGAVPEPGTGLLTALGLVGLAARRRVQAG